jgi:rare lipoprotein A (peptidoglycan hydrolase)
VANGAVTLRVQASAVLGHPLAISGNAPSSDARRSVAIQRQDTRTGAWVPVAFTHTDSRGAFQARWRTSTAGRVPLRAVVFGASAASRGGPSSAAGDSSSAAQITVYRASVATYFGPGFYGQKTACGQTMTTSLVGVANRTLPCGTLVQVSYGGRRLIVPVIDRGPYANGADWDLTSGAADALGITETVHIGTIVVGRVPSDPSLGSPPPSSGSQPSGSSSGGASSPGTTGGSTAG